MKFIFIWIWKTSNLFSILYFSIFDFGVGAIFHCSVGLLLPKLQIYCWYHVKGKCIFPIQILASTCVNIFDWNQSKRMKYRIDTFAKVKVKVTDLISHHNQKIWISFTQSNRMEISNWYVCKSKGWDETNKSERD